MQDIGIQNVSWRGSVVGYMTDETWRFETDRCRRRPKRQLHFIDYSISLIYRTSLNFVPETERQKDMIDTTTIPIDHIDTYNNKIYGFETFHPLVSVVDLSEATQMPNRHSGYYPWIHGKFICKGEGKWRSQDYTKWHNISNPRKISIEALKVVRASPCLSVAVIICHGRSQTNTDWKPKLGRGVLA